MPVGPRRPDQEHRDGAQSHQLPVWKLAQPGGCTGADMPLRDDEVRTDRNRATDDRLMDGVVTFRADGDRGGV